MSSTGLAALVPERMDFLRGIMREHAGLMLAPDKGYLVEARLGAVADRHGLPGAAALIDQLRKAPEGMLRAEAVEAMTIGETSFLRDVHPFKAFGNRVLPDLLLRPAGSEPAAIWCAGCSTGQEPYSLAMTIREHAPAAMAESRISILASDISREAVERARAGRYSQIEVNRGLPVAWLLAWFTREGTRWQLRPEIREMVRCFTANLARQPGPLPWFDVIFARYVLMYLHVDVRRAVLERFRRCLRPGGLLFLGATETLLGLEAGFERVQLDDTVCYRPKPR